LIDKVNINNKYKDKRNLFYIDHILYILRTTWGPSN